MFSGTADYDEAIIDCAKEGAYSCIWTLCGLATVVGRDIISVYPAVNGPNDAGAVILNRVYKRPMWNKYGTDYLHRTNNRVEVWHST